MGLPYFVLDMEEAKEALCSWHYRDLEDYIKQIVEYRERKVRDDRMAGNVGDNTDPTRLLRRNDRVIVSEKS